MKAMCCALWLVLGTQANAESPVLESRITSAGLFKNGLAVIHRAVTVPEAGTYTVMDLPEPAHGTLWLESEAEVVARAATVEVSEPLDALSATPTQQTLAGKLVTVHLADNDQPPVSGRVLSLEPPRGTDAWSRSYTQTPSPWSYAPNMQPTPRPSNFLVIQTTNGRTYIDLNRVATIEEMAGQEEVLRRKPVLELEVSKPTTVSISYLTKGLSWSPSYRVDVTDPDRLQLQQQAVIKNELGDLTDTPLWANNHRNETINLVIQRKFSGNLVEADGDPSTELLEEGVYSVNKRNQLVWELPLGAGEEIEFAYRYDVLVRH